MITKSLVIRRSFLVMSVGVVLIASGDRCLSQDVEQKGNEVRQVQILLEAEGNDVQQLRELVERLQVAQEDSEKRTTRDVEVAVFAVPEPAQKGPDGPQNAGHPRVGLSFTGPPPAGPQNFGPPNFGPQNSGPPGFGPPGFGPPGLRMGGRAEMQQGQGPQIHHPETHGPEGPFAEDRKRIAALTESAERITQAGLPDVAHGLRERAGQLERELAEKQERMQQEERRRMESAMRERQAQTRQQPQPHQPQRLMEQRFEGIERGDHPTPPLRELHEQLEQIRHDMHKLSEQMADLTRLIQQHHNPRINRGHHEDMDDDEDGDDEDGDGEDGDDENGDGENGDGENGDGEDGDGENGDGENGEEEDLKERG